MATLYIYIYSFREVEWFSEGRVSTTENVAIFVWNTLVDHIPQPAKLTEVRNTLVDYIPQPAKLTEVMNTLVDYIPQPAQLTEVRNTLVDYIPQPY